jgi:GTP-binding protein HflX
VSTETIYGRLQGLKPSEIKRLQQLYHQRLPSDRLTTSEFAQRLAAISTEIKQPICAYINRRGQVLRIALGTPHQTQIPPLELPRYGAERLCGIRCIATQMEPGSPNRATLTAMALQRLDVLITLALSGQGFQRRGGGATGYVQTAYIAHLLPQGDPNWVLSSPLTLDQLSQQDFLALVTAIEAEFQQAFVARQVEDGCDRVVLVGLLDGERSSEVLDELARLVESAGGEVLDTIGQRRSASHPQTVVGEGKVQEIALNVQALGANLVVFDRDLSPAQVRNLEARLGVRVVDRTEVILDIFAQRAQSRAGKLQVELAQLEYCLPRLVGRGQAMSRLGGGIGTRGPGETKLETERRAIQKRIARLQQEVNQLQAHRTRLRQRRQRRNVPSIALVGYTNAGKSTLLNALTHAEVYTADQLFATLDPTTRKVIIPNPVTQMPYTLLLTDTVGFIHELPPSLVDAFRATLEEVTEADALLHVVDLSHPGWQHQIQAVQSILADMPFSPDTVLLAFNKVDAVESEMLQLAQQEYPQAVFISARDRLGLETLRHRLLQIAHYAAVF